MVRIGIIGLGGVGRTLLASFTAHPHTEVVAVCDVMADEAKKMAEEFGNLALYSDYRQLLENESIDLVYVAVPPKFHYEIVMDALSKGKHILCEKPLANSIKQAREMRDKAEKSGVVHAMNFPTYYRSAFGQLERLVSAGYIGQLRRVEVRAHFHTWPRKWQQNAWIASREQGGFVREVVPHFIQLIQHMFGTITNVQAQMEYPANESLCETGVVATMEVQDGIPILIDGLSQIAKPEEVSFTMYGTDGTLSLYDWGRLKGGKTGEHMTEIPLEQKDHLEDLISNLVYAVNGKQACLFDFGVGYNVQKVLEVMLQEK